jgi:superfamily II DNA or RNA helicase
MLRDYQQQSVLDVYASLREHRSCILQLPTGAGKTHVAMAIIKKGLEHGKRINFCVDRLTLLDQTLDKFMEAGIPLGVVQGGHPLSNLSKPVQVVSTQTLARRNRDRWPPADLFIIDEAHTNYKIISEVMERWDALKYIGLTATPWTRYLGNTWDDLVVGTTTGKLIEMGFLSEYEAYGPSSPDLTGVRRSGNDFALADLADRMNVLTGDIVKHYIDHGEGKKALAFTPTVAYAQHLADEFCRAGVRADHVSGHDTDERRAYMMNAYRSGEIRVMTNCEVLTKGFDDADIEYGILARPTRSLSLHIQMIGRFLRASEGKKAIIMDHSSNIERLGFPDDPLPTHLNMGEPGVNPDTREADEPEPWNCPNCHALVPPRTPQCPACGHMARTPHEVDERPGVLQKLDNEHTTERMLKQDVYSQLLWICDKHGYASGWAAHKYRTLFDVWPRKVEPTRKYPTPEILSWVKSQNIRHAKRRQA